ncbi:hypothetical protein MUP59_05830 [Candidatus Bathyarchaeota archaeon]|nr:hypothetical protein [Candidatus Bathyarchaeota archaeon]
MSDKKYGRNTAKCNQYHNLHLREKHKVVRILQSNGLGYAIMWAFNHGVYGFFCQYARAHGYEELPVPGQPLEINTI